MKYMLLVYSPENSWTQEEWNSCAVESSVVCHDLHSHGKFISASPLQPVATATSVRVRQGKPIVTSGPFAETTEQLGGFFLIDVANLDEAIEVAVRLPAAKKGTIEIRPIASLEGLPNDRFHTDPMTTHGDSRYMLLSYDNEQYWNAVGPDVFRAAQQEAVELTRQLDSRGKYICASPLHPVATATSVRIREQRRIVTDGPFAETNEILGGFYLIYAHDLNEAIHVASQHSGARVGTVEIRKLVDLTGLPA